MQPVIQRLAEIASRMSDYQDQLDAFKRAFDATARQSQVELLAAKFEALPRSDQLEELSQTLKKLGRTQFKANALGESKESQVESALGTLQEIIDRRDQLQDQRRLQDQERLDSERRQARGALAADFLPVLDGLEMALDNGRSLLAQQRQALENEQAEREVKRRALAEAPAAPPPGVWEKLRRSFSPPPVPAASQTAPAASSPQEGEATSPLPYTFINETAAWLEGLDLVRERMQALLAAEGIREIPALGQPFDPHLHVALETTSATDASDNTVVRVVRKGYQQQRRVLRYAEVVVARHPKQPLRSAETEAPFEQESHTEAVAATKGRDSREAGQPLFSDAQELTALRSEPRIDDGIQELPASIATDGWPNEETVQHEEQHNSSGTDTDRDDGAIDDEHLTGRDSYYG
ncbi:MAG: nucleotide exchange factor GrpE [Caldilineaceae bacterium]|nr:nucleotide exchange factor GrpE [Caldilineaceae bacterium]